MNDEDALLWMVNMGCIDMNTWYSRVDKPDRPDFVLFDLDPSPDVGFAETVQVALLVKAALDALGLESFAEDDRAPTACTCSSRSSGGYTYDDTREFSEIVAGAIARTHRGLATTEWSKSKRRGVLIDSNQNGEGKTIASVVLRAAARGRAGVDAAALGRGERGRSTRRRSRWTSCSSAFGSTATSSPACSRRQRLDRALKALR